MMAAREPKDVQHEFIQAFNAGNLAGLLALYEPGASFVPQPGQVVTGTNAIREVLGGFLAMKGTLALNKQTVVPAGDVALLHGEWTLRSTSPDGKPVETAMRSSEVVRRQPDGTWRYVVDNPYSFA
jgi:uncharacterized protein (TIGR02246 family)